jgi:hypothetical protein
MPPGPGTLPGRPSEGRDSACALFLTSQDSCSSSQEVSGGQREAAMRCSQGRDDTKRASGEVLLASGALHQVLSWLLASTSCATCDQLTPVGQGEGDTMCGAWGWGGQGGR